MVRHLMQSAGRAAPLGPWMAATAIAILCFAGIEALLRTERLWHLPLGYLLRNPGDSYTRAVWLSYNPPDRQDETILVLGASTAAAVMQLPDNESESTIQSALGQPDLQLLTLTLSQGCYAEHLTILQNALAHGHRPKTIIVFAWPGCLTERPETDTLAARRMPLVSSWLAEMGIDSPRLRVKSAILQVSAVMRYQFMINAWLRSRWEGVLGGRPPWEPIVFSSGQRETTWEKPWEEDRDRYQRLRLLPKRLHTTGRSMQVLDRLLRIARDHAQSVLVVESPWSPPIVDVLRDGGVPYTATMQAAAVRAGVVYTDPNSELRLERESFNDLYHVNHAGARRYLAPMAAALRRARSTS